MDSSDRLPQRRRDEIIRPLLEYLDGGGHRPDGPWQAWQIQRVDGGRNNLLYRVSGPDGDLVVKFTVRDQRDRAGREYGALTALRRAGLCLAPEPLLLDRSRYAQPVVVQTWLAGEVSTTPPTADAGWQSLAQHLASVHAVTPEKTRIRLRESTINASNVEQGRQRVREQVAQIPEEVQPASLRALVRRFESARFLEWASAPVALCRLDNNITNYVQRPGPWASVDWEYSGWGDPAFDVANLVTHVAYLEVPAWRWGWFIDTYCELVEDATATVRIPAYCEILLVWWAARLARYLYEIPRGRDQRLVDWPADWQADIETKYEQYIDRATGATHLR